MCHPPQGNRGIAAAADSASAAATAAAAAAAAAASKQEPAAINVDDAVAQSATASSLIDLRYQRRIRAAKRAARSELSVSRGDWTRQRYHEGKLNLLPATSSDKGKSRSSFEQDPTSLDGVVDDVPRLDLSTLSSSPSFASLFEAPRIPCVLTRSAIASWPAFNRGPRSWIDADGGSSLEALVRRYEQQQQQGTGNKDKKNKPRKLKVGTDDDGRAVYLSVADFARYCRDPRHGLVDDSPLYIFDSGFASDEEEGSGSSSSSESESESNESGSENANGRWRASDLQIKIY